MTWNSKQGFRLTFDDVSRASWLRNLWKAWLSTSGCQGQTLAEASSSQFEIRTHQGSFAKYIRIIIDAGTEQNNDFVRIHDISDQTEGDRMKIPTVGNKGQENIFQVDEVM